MSNDKSKDDERPLYRSEIFKRPPDAQGAGGSGNLSNTIGAEQGIEFFGGDAQPARRARPNKKYLEPAREIPVFAETDVLVVGGGPAGTAAAIAAARLGADVLLVERYNHLGGLSTGGLVIWIDRMTRLVGPAHHQRHRQRPDGAAAQGRDPGPQARRLGLQGRRHRRLLGPAHRRLPRHRHLVADHRSRGPQDRLHADGGRGQGAPAAARLGHRTDPRRQRRQGRHLREQGRPPRRSLPRS